MKEIAGKTLAQLCLYSAAKYKNRIAFAMFSDGQISKRITYAQFGSRACQIGSILRRMGVKNGDRVLLLSENCSQWPLAYFGIALAGAVSVPLLTGFSPEQIQHIAEHSQVKAVCVSGAMAEKIKNSVVSHLPSICIDNLTEQNDFKEDIYVSENPDELAAIIYTSGTQGISKGVMLSSGNLISSTLSSLAFEKMYPNDRILSVLPLAHSYECSLGLLAPVISGASVTYLDRPPSASILLPAVKVIRPTAIFSVPLLIEKIYNNAIAPKLRNSKLYKFSFTRPLAIWFAGRKLISALGGRIRAFGIGGAPLSPEVEEFLYKARFPYTIGYGLTEAAPLIAGNTPLRYSHKAGIGAAKGVEIRIAKCTTDADEGEIQVRGPNIMLGYFNDIERTAEAFTSDGWLRTGDLGRIEKKGRLHVRGRLKALILGPSGENIYPEEIESLLISSQIVEESVVFLGKKGELVALVTLNEAAKAAAGVVENTLEELRSWVNKKLAVFSRLSKIEIRNEPFEKTPTMKIKRYLYV